MDSFELSTDSYDPSELRRDSRRKPVQPDDVDRGKLSDIDETLNHSSEKKRIVTPADNETTSTAAQTSNASTKPTRVRQRVQKRQVSEPLQNVTATTVEPAVSQASTNTEASDNAVSTDTAHHEPRQIISPSVKQFLSDGRWRTFFGVVLILIAAYMLLASISYIANATDDQSVLFNNTTEMLKAHSASVNNTTGWFGAMLSHFIFYRWIGLGAFAIIYYIGMLGLSMVNLCKSNFWSLTFKSLVSALSLSLISGLVTFNSISPAFWGGEHGYFINKFLIDNASLWSAIAVSIAMLTAMILIFIKPVSFITSSILHGIRSIKGSMAQRHDAAIEAAHRTEMRYQAEKEAEQRRVEQAQKETETISQDEPTGTISHEEDLSAPIVEPTPKPKPKPTPLDELYAPIAPTVSINDLTDEFHSSQSTNDQQTNLTELTDIDDSIKEQQTSSAVNDNNNDDIPTEEIAATEEITVTVSQNISEPTNEANGIIEKTETLSKPVKISISVPDNAVSSISLDSEDEIEDEVDKNDTTSDNVEQQSIASITKPTSEIAKVDTPPMSIELNPIEKAEVIDNNVYDPTAELSHYKFPPIELLNDIQNTVSPIDEEEQEANKERITNILSSYGVEISSITATIGPTITLYEIVPAPGVRIAKIKRLGDDVALNLSAMGIRIIAPIPGKGTIGMEVPNKNKLIVSMRSILTSKAYRESKAQLPIALGTTISNEVYVADLAKMPHLLVAGATGMGKSVGLNAIITSLLYRKHPAELKFVLVDPKMVEFSLYKCIERHYLAKLPDDEEKAIITDPLKVVTTLNSLCLEMDNRYALLSEAGMRGIKEYNDKFISRCLNPEKGHRFLPYIVVVIDEFADLILTAGKEVENPISRIAAKARAVGIHMILATQRPSVNVITGVIKANFPGRMAFRVTQRNDSQTILDRPGAEQLIGRGDMLISRDGMTERVQCAFIDTPEVESICNYISSQQAYPHAYELPEVTTASESSSGSGSLTDRDPLFADAGREIIGQGIGSASSLQRKFNIGYPRAGKIMDQLEMAGVVGPTQGGKPRAVLMDMYSFERLLESL